MPPPAAERARSAFGASTSGRAAPTHRTPTPRHAPRATAAASAGSPLPADWRARARPIAPGRPYPAKEHCSACGLCDSYFVALVKDACSFLGDGMARGEAAEVAVHGRGRRLGDAAERRFGVTQRMAYVKARAPVAGAQWTGVVTTIAAAMLDSGAVDAVVCVQSDPDDPRAPRPVVARSRAEVLAAAGVKATLSPSLSVLPAVEGLVADGSVKRLLVIGVGCQIQALRAIEPLLGLERLYVLGTNCADNGPRGGLDKFLDAASAEPGRVTHYEFAQDYRVHLRRDDGAYERIPYFCLPAAELSTGVIAPSCLSCFDYSNSLADLVVGYMGVPLDPKTPMHAHQGYLTVRNARGEEMLAAAGAALELSPTESRPGLFSRAMLAWQTALADDQAKTGGAPAAGAPRWLGELLATLLTWLGPSGLEFAAYSIDYHALRNWVHVRRHWGAARADAHVPPSAKLIVEEYDRKGAVSARAALAAPFPGARLEERE